jgi:hypothetical protein
LQSFNKFGNLGQEKKIVYATEEIWNEKKIENIFVFEIRIENFCFLSWKIWPYHHREMGKIEQKDWFWNVNSNLKILGHTIKGKWKILRYATKNWNEKKWKFSFFWNLKWKNWKFSSLKFETEISFWNLNKKWPYH